MKLKKPFQIIQKKAEEEEKGKLTKQNKGDKQNQIIKKLQGRKIIRDTYLLLKIICHGAKSTHYFYIR